MSSKQNVKTCLIITYGPVPTPQYQTVEGGGMRAWGIAKGLLAHDLRVTVAVNGGFPQELDEHEGIHLTNWTDGEQLGDLINSYDMVIVSYCMGNTSVYIADTIHQDVLLVLDVYVPIFVEVSARESADIDHEFRHYMEDIKRFNHVLKRGDYFLCASDSQKVFYTGVLSSLGVLNPRSYRQKRILIVPFGIHDTPAVPTINPYRELSIAEKDMVIMWFGGLYPWFRVDELLQAIIKLSAKTHLKFVFVGGKNPFNPNPDFAKQYELAIDVFTKAGLVNKSVFFVDWVNFDKRVDYFKHADVVISLNQPGEENMLSWRTRVMDFVWGELAILTNGGDPLSEDLLAEQAAIRLPELSAKSIHDTIERLYENPTQLKAIRDKILEIKPRYYWQTVVEPIIQEVKTGFLPHSDEQHYRRKLRIASGLTEVPEPEWLRKTKKISRLPRKVYTTARTKGLRRTFKLGASIAYKQASTRIQSQNQRFIFISHPLDHTGAPKVLLDIIHECVTTYNPNRVQLIAPHVTDSHLRRLREIGVKVDKAALGLGHRLLKLQLNIRPDDIVVMNTVAIYDNYRDFIFGSLEHGKLAHAFWFIHEDRAQLPLISRYFEEKSHLARIKKLVDSGKLTILVPTQQTKTDYDALIDTTKVKVVPLRVEIDAKYLEPRKKSDFDDLRFIISGTPSDGRKGQLLAEAAFHTFMTTYYNKTPSVYRDFSLHLISIGNDYISQQIKWIGDSLLPGKIHTYSQMPYNDAMDVTRSCNVTICCSLNETFALYVAEGMFMGHILLRNNSAGMAEQLHDGINGLLISNEDIHQFAAQIERLLNKKTTTNKVLADMSAASQEIIAPYKNNTYLQYFTPFIHK